MKCKLWQSQLHNSDHSVAQLIHDSCVVERVPRRKREFVGKQTLSCTGPVLALEHRGRSCCHIFPVELKTFWNLVQLKIFGCFSYFNSFYVHFPFLSLQWKDFGATVVSRPFQVCRATHVSTKFLHKPVLQPLSSTWRKERVNGMQNAK